MDDNSADCGSGGLCCRSSSCSVKPQAVALEHVMTLSFFERIWQVHWNERSQKITIFLVTSDVYGNARVLKKIKTIGPSSADFPSISDGRSLLEASVALIEKFSSKTAEPQFFTGTK